MAEKKQWRPKRRKKSDRPKNYARAALDKQRLGELSGPISTIGFGGKEGREHSRPRCIVRRLVERSEPYHEHGLSRTGTDHHGPAGTNRDSDRGEGERWVSGKS